MLFLPLSGLLSPLLQLFLRPRNSSAILSKVVLSDRQENFLLGNTGEGAGGTRFINSFFNIMNI
jgi:hypothetical protein